MWGLGKGEWGGGTYIHVHAPGEQDLARRVQQQNPLDQVERVDDEEVVLAVAAAGDEPVERGQQAVRDVPLEAFLEFEELAEGRVGAEVGEALSRGRGGGFGGLCGRGGGGLVLLLGAAAGAREADLRKEAFDLL